MPWSRVVVAVAIAQAYLGPVHGAELTAGVPSVAEPQEYHFGDVTVIGKGTAVFGTIIRADDRDPKLIPQGNGASVGVNGKARGGVNNDDGDLNYDRGDRVSTVLKVVTDADVKYKNLGMFARLKAWYDFVQEDKDVPHGNVPNDYVPGEPLSDAGFSRLGKFSGADLRGNGYGTFDIYGKTLFTRVGYQTIDWGSPGTIPGGLEQINPIDNPARLRAGAVPEETRILFPAVFASLGLIKNLNVEAFYQFKFEPNELPGCGVFGSFLDYATEGCDKVFVAPVTVSDATSLATGSYLERASDGDPSNGGQYGFGLTYLAENLGQFGAYFANYHSRRLAVSVIKSSRTEGEPFIPGNPGGENTQYYIEYPENIKVFGLSFKTQLPDQTRIFAEYTYRPNQTIQWATSDLLLAFVSNTAPTLLRAAATATPPGGNFHGYDRLKMSQFGAGAAKPLGKVLGGDLTLAGEVGIKYIHDLPDQSERRYVRADFYGLGPVNGVCLPGAPSYQCSEDGYASSLSWGYRLRVSSIYGNVIDGVDLKPTITFVHDVKGWSYDGVFNEGRKLAIVALQADVKKRFFVEASWTPIWGGTYNFTKDRDFYGLAIGATF
ncbi:MAG: DUF1302 domain-containing protein [Polyangiales bacterium]